MAKYTAQELTHILMSSLMAVGFSHEAATALTAQTVLAEELGQSAVGVAHVFDYINGAQDGRIDPKAEPKVTRPLPTLFHVDGAGGLPQTGFDVAFDDLVRTTRQHGVALYLGHNAMLCGALGTFALRLAEQGLVALAATNGSPLLAGSGSKEPVFCTNPMAFAAPQGGQFPLLIDQSCSATAYVNIRAAAETGQTIPEGWAIDKNGHPTSDPRAAMEGSLLPFGGARGSNLALMVEILAAGLTGANYAIEAAPFDKGDHCPGTGLFILVINPEPAAPGFAARTGRYLRRMKEAFGVYVPGLSKGRHQKGARKNGLTIDDCHISRLMALVKA